MTEITDRLLDCGLCYEENGEEVHPHPECPLGGTATMTSGARPEPPTDNGPFPCPVTDLRGYLIDATVAYERYDHDSCDYDHDFDETAARQAAEELLDTVTRVHTAPDAATEETPGA